MLSESIFSIGSSFKSSVSHTEPRYVRLVNTTPEFFGTRLSLRAMCLAAAFTKTSYTILRGSITWREFSVILARKLLVFSGENSVHLLAKLNTNCFHCISGLLRLYLAKTVPVKTQPISPKINGMQNLLKFIKIFTLGPVRWVVNDSY